VSRHTQSHTFCIDSPRVVVRVQISQPGRPHTYALTRVSASPPVAIAVARQHHHVTVRRRARPQFLAGSLKLGRQFPEPRKREGEKKELRPSEGVSVCGLLQRGPEKGPSFYHCYNTPLQMKMNCSACRLIACFHELTEEKKRNSCTI
jgi:hypothetical protein